MKYTVALALACSLFAPLASAQNPRPNPQPNPQLPKLPASQQQQGPTGPFSGLGQFGQPANNGQGAAAQQAARAEIMRRFDRDGDGRLNAQEQIAATRAMQERGMATPGQPNMVGRGNGGVQTGAPAPQQQPSQPAAPKLNKREELLLKRFDRDGDGKLNDEEKAAARAEFSQKGNKAENKAENKK